jgi:hypothetical protein
MTKYDIWTINLSYSVLGMKQYSLQQNSICYWKYSDITAHYHVFLFMLMHKTNTILT